MAQTTKRKLPQPSIALKNENAYLKQLVRELKTQNAKCQKKIAQLEARNVSSTNRIKVLEKQKLAPDPKPMSDLEIARRIAFLLNKGGLDIHGNPRPKK